MEERARERRDGGFTSPRSFPRSCITGRELPEFCALIVLRLAPSPPQPTGARTSVRIKSRIAHSGCSHLAPRDQQAPKRNKFRAPKRVAARDHFRSAAGRLPQSETMARVAQHGTRRSFWSAPALWRFWSLAGQIDSRPEPKHRATNSENRKSNIEHRTSNAVQPTGAR